MTSSVHFRFKSARQFETLPFDGDFLKVADLKVAIVERKKLNFGEGFDLEISDASTNDGMFFVVIAELGTLLFPSFLVVTERAPFRTLLN